MIIYYNEGKTICKTSDWYIGGKKRRYRKQRRKWFLTGVNASAAAPFLGEVAKPILKKIFGSQRRRQRSKKK